MPTPRDHVDRASWDVYVNDPHHFRVGNYIDTITRTELTARIDYLYAGPTSTRGRLRHIVMYRWRDGVDDAAKAAVRKALKALPAACPTVRWLGVADDLLWFPPNYNWIVESHFDDPEGLKAFLDNPAHRKAAALIAASTKADAVAQLQHRMLAG